MLNLTAKLKNSYVLEKEEEEAAVNLQRQNSQPEATSTIERRDSLSAISTSAQDFERSNSDDTQERLKRMQSTDIEKYSHLLIGKVKDTQFMFGFIVEASLIDVPQGA